MPINVKQSFDRVFAWRCSVTDIDIAPCGCRVTGPSDDNLGPVTRHPQGAVIKQLGRIS